MPKYKDGFVFNSKVVITTTTELTAGVLTYDHDLKTKLFEKEYVIHGGKIKSCMLPARPSRRDGRSMKPR
ncbi:hypothetical protein DCC85_01560 [Paenibacillus sp. CAA11]|nr:hypothetical protein DCC85_01560 [Paenibacillus sp. CAA11]